MSAFRSVQELSRRIRGKAFVRKAMAIVALIVLCCLVGGCVLDSFVLVPVVEQCRGGAMDVIYQGGYPIVFAGDAEGRAVAVLGFKESSEEQMALVVSLVNNSAGRAEVVPEQIRVSAWRRGKPVELKVWSADEYLRRLRTQQTIALILMGVSAALNTQYAGYMTTTGTIYSGGTYTHVYLQTYSAAAARAETTAEADRLRRYAAAADASYQATSNGLLKRHTLMPNEYVEGVVMIDYQRFDALEVRIPFGESEYVFVLAMP